MTFLHGPETPIVALGSRPVRDTEVAVIGLVGTSPQYLVATADKSLNVPKLILNRAQAVQFFGSHRTGYTMPKAFDAIFDQVGNQGGVKVIGINVLDETSAIATTNVVDASLTFNSADVIQLPYGLTGVVVTAVGGTPTYVLDTDYSLDAASGVITRLSGGSIPSEGTVEIDYTYPSGGDKTAVVDASKTFPTSGALYDIIQLEEGLSAVTVTGTGGTPTYVLNTDYSLNTQTGQITRISSGSIAEGATVEVDYTYVDPSIVQNSQIIGGVDANGDRTGLHALKDAFNLFGFFPKIIIAPGYSPIEGVTSEMNVVCGSIDAMALVDAPLGTSYNDVITGRGPSGVINFFFSSNRLAGCYPHLKGYDTILEAETTEPMSPRLAGVWANKMIEKGWWWSPSNTEFKGITGVERDMEFIPGDLSSEANILNSNGIVTVANYFGSGYRSWGNRSFAYPNSTAVDNFLNIKMSQIIINERIRYWAMQFIDHPIDDPLIDAILESVGAYLRTLVREGAIVDGTIVYDPADNPAAELAQGLLKFRVSFMPPPPAERITFYSYLDFNLLETLNVGREAA